MTSGWLDVPPHPASDYKEALARFEVFRKDEGEIVNPFHTDTVVDIGRGLGRRVALVGFSIGGVIAAWAVQQRADIDQAVIIVPSSVTA